MENIVSITKTELQNKLNSNKNFYFWNVLTDDNFKGELIPGSTWVPLDRIDRKIKDSNISENDEIVVYCGSESCPQSTKAAEKLKDLGFNKVYDFEGGIKEWQESGNNIENIEN